MEIFEYFIQIFETILTNEISLKGQFHVEFDFVLEII